MNVAFLEGGKRPLAHPGRLLTDLLHSPATVPLHAVGGGYAPDRGGEYDSGRLLPFLTAGFERQAHHRAETALQAEVDHLPQEFAWRRYKLRLFMPSGTSS